MAMAETTCNGFEFLSDPSNRLPLPDLAAENSLLRGEADQSLACAVAQSSNSGMGDAAVTIQEEFDSGSKKITLSNSEHSTDRGGGQAPDMPNSFRFLDLSGRRSLLDGEAIQPLVCTVAESSIGDVGDPADKIKVDVNNTCNGIALSLANSEHSTGKDNPQAPGWTKGYTNVDVCFYFEHMTSLTGLYIPC
ncbi:hypothetical protein ACQJBY_050285 [Aegilops geniculata]